LQRLHGTLLGGLILGALWALWHLPGFLVPSQAISDIPPRGTVMDFVRFVPALTALAYIIQWVFNGTGGSVLLTMLTHASWNSFYRASLIGIFPAPAVMGSYLNLLIGGWALPLVLIALTRGRLATEKAPMLPMRLRRMQLRPFFLPLFTSVVERLSEKSRRLWFRALRVEKRGEIALFLP
jgi:hypothetical protein